MTFLKNSKQLDYLHSENELSITLKIITYNFFNFLKKKIYYNKQYYLQTKSYQHWNFFIIHSTNYIYYNAIKIK